MWVIRFLLPHGVYFEHVSDMSPSAKNGIGRQLQHANCFEAEFCNGERAHVLFNVDHAFAVIEKDQVNGEQHPNRVYAV